jgi:hypothetical protein
MVDKHADSIDSFMLDRDDGLRADRRVSRSVGVGFMCLQYGMEEAAKHPVPDGKYAKVACVHKSVPRIIK